MTACCVILFFCLFVYFLFSLFCTKRSVIDLMLGPVFSGSTTTTVALSVQRRGVGSRSPGLSTSRATASPTWVPSLFSATQKVRDCIQQQGNFPKRTELLGVMRAVIHQPKHPVNQRSKFNFWVTSRVGWLKTFFTGQMNTVFSTEDSLNVLLYTVIMCWMQITPYIDHGSHADIRGEALKKKKIYQKDGRLIWKASARRVVTNSLLLAKEDQMFARSRWPVLSSDPAVNKEDFFSTFTSLVVCLGVLKNLNIANSASFQKHIPLCFKA